jgi:hypothetical protein
MASRVKWSLAVTRPESWQQSGGLAAKTLFCNIFLETIPPFVTFEEGKSDSVV